MYDAIDDPYTYENSTVLVNKLELREQAELDAFYAAFARTLSASTHFSEHRTKTDAHAKGPSPGTWLSSSLIPSGSLNSSE
jgi:hypothetical protein